MLTIDKVLRLVIVLLSFLGYFQLLNTKLKPEFSIGVILSSVGSLAFLSGIFDVMPQTVLAVIAVGILCLIVSLVKRVPLKNIFSPGVIFFGVMCLVIVYFVYGACFVEQDNFTHWAYVTKVIIRNDRFPVPTDPNILFPSYPLGSASFIYFFCEALNVGNEWIQMFFQNMLQIGMACSLFAFATNLKQRISAAAVAIFMFACYIGFRELLVDNLLAIVGFGGIAFCVYYKDEIADKIWYTIPYMIILMAIKNSGILFAIYIILFSLIFINKNVKNIAKLAVCSATPFISLVLWQKHVETTFENGLTSKHSMSLANFEKIFGGKTAEDIQVITTKFLKEMFSFSNYFIYLLVFILAAWLLNKYVFKEDNKEFSKLALLLLFAYIAYQIGMYGMFMFTMPRSEALVLACYERYHRTILVYVSGLAYIAMLRYKIPQKYLDKIPQVALYAVYVAVLGLAISPNFAYYKRQEIPETHHRSILNNLIAENNFVEDAGYVIIIDDNYFPVDPLNYTAKYLLGHSAKTRTLQRVKDNPAILEQYPNIIVYSHTEAVLEYVSGIFAPDAPNVYYAPDFQ